MQPTKSIWNTCYALLYHTVCYRVKSEVSNAIIKVIAPGCHLPYAISQCYLPPNRSEHRKTVSLLSSMMTKMHLPIIIIIIILLLLFICLFKIFIFLTGQLAFCCRLTPVYMVLIGVLASLFVYFGDGPLWLYTDPKYDTYGACKDNWWTNLLYVNNLVHPSHQVCLLHFCV